MASSPGTYIRHDGTIIAHFLQYFNGGFNALVAVFLFFFLEETNFERPETEIVTLQAGTLDDANLTNTISIGDKKDLFETSVQELQTVEDPSFAAQPEAGEVVHNAKFTKPWLTFGTVSPHAAAVMLRGCLVPLTLLALPLVWWIGLMYGIYQIWFNSE
jgi:hypothetical protein